MSQWAEAMLEPCWSGDLDLGQCRPGWACPHRRRFGLVVSEAEVQGHTLLRYISRGF